MRFTVYAALFLLCFASVAHAGAEDKQKGLLANWGIGVQYWNPSLSGKAGSSGHMLNHESFGLKAPSQVSIFPFQQKQGHWRMHVDFHDFDSISTVNAGTVFGLPVAGQTRTRLDLRSVDLAYMPGITAEGPDAFSWLWGVKIYRHEMKVQTATAQTEKTFNGIRPITGFRLDKNRTAPTAWYIEAAGCPGSRYIFDWEAAVVQKLSAHTSLAVGYRSSMQKAAEGADILSYRLAGPFARVKHSF